MERTGYAALRLARSASALSERALYAFLKEEAGIEAFLPHTASYAVTRAGESLGVGSGDALFVTLLSLLLYSREGNIAASESRFFRALETRLPERAEDAVSCARVTAALAEAKKDFKTFVTRFPLLFGKKECASFIVHAYERYYLRNAFEYEERFFNAFFLKASSPDLNDPRIDSAIETATLPFKETPFAASEEQLHAVRNALARNVSLLTGGPGTGKTATITHCLRAFIEYAQREDERAVPVVLIAAPTGRAASRVSESIRRAIERMPYRKEIDALLPSEAVTLHTLLGVSKDANRAPRYTAENPLRADFVIVDEASMVDMTRMAELLEALDRETKLLLVGDPYQLPSVEAGAAFANSIPREEDTTHPFQSIVARLTKNYRTSLEALSSFYTAVRKGDMSACIAIARANSSVVRFEPLEEGRDALAALDCSIKKEDAFMRLMSAALPPFFFDEAHVEEENARATALFEILTAVAIITPLRVGRFGTRAINERVKQALVPSGTPAFAGMPVLVTANDYALGVFNGERGVLVINANDGAYTALFPNDGADASSYRAIPYERLTASETAYAMTAHKSQGSEFNRVILFFPKEARRFMTREIVYTAATRASESLLCLADEETIAQALSRVTERESAIAMRFAEKRDNAPRA